MSNRSPAQLLVFALLAATWTTPLAAGLWQCITLPNGLWECTGVTLPAEPLMSGDSEAAPGTTDITADPIFAPAPAATAVTAPATTQPDGDTPETPATLDPTATPAAGQWIPPAE
ncbi:MAG: hypothetical protein QNL87_00355, partial [Gammaproteobacteria bacterium]|nr:hypothetical protein [Gammaproteobacteria bacterium]